MHHAGYLLMNIMRYFILIGFLFLENLVFTPASAALELNARFQKEKAPKTQLFETEDRVLNWDPKKTAIIICDMWNQHWCKGATARVGEMAPVMNRVIEEARKKGVIIIHAPSETLEYYRDSAARKHAQQAPKANSPQSASGWQSLNLNKEPRLPIDDSDGGCDCFPQCKTGNPWRSQIATLQILDIDYITDRGDELINILQDRGIENVIIMGVHTNMCVLGRPFGIRSLVRLGKNVALMRDMTDTMYNSRKKPFVSHFRGTDLVINHIEKYWCPTITSSDFTGQPSFHFSQDYRPTIALLIGEEEYEAKKTLPEFAARELAYRFGCLIDVMQSDRTNSLPGLERLSKADLMVVYLRRRTLPDEQLAYIRQYLASGKPVVGIRTASHAFQNWLAFDKEILGGNYHGHFGKPKDDSICNWLTVSTNTSPILQGLSTNKFGSKSWLYKTSPLAESTQVLLWGQTAADQPAEPVAWINNRIGTRIFYTSLGHPDDFKQEFFCRLLRNAIFWAVKSPSSYLEVPSN